MFLRVLLNWLKAPLTPMERTFIGIVAGRLSPTAKGLLMRQVDNVNYVQRHANHKEVNLYRIRWGKAVSDERSLFPLRAETKLASVEFRCRGAEGAFAADLWLANGRLFSIEYDRSPVACSMETIEEVRVTIHADPMNPTSLLPTPLASARLSGWVLGWSKKGLLSDLHEPLAQDKRAQLIAGINATLPSDYIELVSQTEGLGIRGWRVLGLSGIRRIIMPGKDYYVLAEKEGLGVLCVVQSSTSGEVHFLDFEEQDDRPVGRSVRAFIEETLT